MEIETPLEPNASSCDRLHMDEGLRPVEGQKEAEAM